MRVLESGPTGGLVEAPGTDWAHSPSLDSSVIHAWVPAPGEGKGEGEGAHGNRSSLQDLQSAGDPGQQLGQCWGVYVTFAGIWRGQGGRRAQGDFLRPVLQPRSWMDGTAAAGLGSAREVGAEGLGWALQGTPAVPVSLENSTNALQAFLAEGSDQVSVWGPLGRSGEQGSHEWAWGLLPGPDQSGVLWGSVCLPLSPPAVNAAQLPFPEPGGSR